MSNGLEKYWVSENELYPVLNIQKEKPNLSNEYVELTKEEVKKIKKVFNDFQEIQRLISSKLKEQK